MAEEKCKCGEYKTINQVTYKNPHITTRECMLKNIQEDPCTINGEFANNLQINRKPIPYKVVDHPVVKDRHEEMSKFLDKLPHKDKFIYCKYFASENDLSKIKKYINDMNRSTYSMDYSPDGTYIPLKPGLHLLRLPGKFEFKHELTTYGDSYNRIAEMENVKEFIKITKICEKTRKRLLQDELQRIYKTGKTTYYCDISGPAAMLMEKNRKKNLLKDGPLDMFTLRKL